MNEILEFGGVLNYELIWGIPRYIGLIAGTIIIGVIIWYLCKRYFDNLQPVDGIYYSQVTRHLSGNPAFVIGKANELELATEKSTKMIFADETYREAITYEKDWKKTCYTSCGGIDCDIIVDLADWTARGFGDLGFLSYEYPNIPKNIPIIIAQGIARFVYNSILAPLFWWPKLVGSSAPKVSEAHDIIDRCATTWNEHELEEARQHNPDAKMGKNEIHSLLKFRDYLIAGKITCPELRDDQIWYIASWQRIKSAFRMYDTVDSGGWVMQRAQEFNRDNEGTAMMDKWLFYVLGFYGIIVLLIAIPHLLPK